MTRRRGRRFVAAAVAVAVAITLAPGMPAHAAPGLGTPALPKPHVDKVKPFTATAQGKAAMADARASNAATAAAARMAQADQRRPAAWPTSATATTTLPMSGPVNVAAGGLRLTLGSAANRQRPSSTLERSADPSTATAEIRVLGRDKAAQAGVQGVLVGLRPTEDRRVSLTLDYSSFANAYGGDFGGRLQLVRLPACAATTPQRAPCRVRSTIPFRNERKAQKLTTELSLTAAQRTVLAVEPGTKSGGGDYKATPLSPSSTWSAGSSSGSFSWSYPLAVPEPAAGPKPDLKITYDSGSVDGQTASSNNQGTLIGTGFDLSTSYIERKYHSCDDDGQKDKFDLCWNEHNAVLVLNGAASELVLNDPEGDWKPGDPEVWRLKNDNATKVERLTGDRGADNGAHDGEHWRLTTSDGTQYTFGLNKLPGAAGSVRTRSTWTVPVFGDDKGEPCHAASDKFDDSDCVQAWRWNVDYVTDTHGNAMTYWYTPEVNYYAKNGKDEPGTSYVRGGYLDRIEYGLRSNRLFGDGVRAAQTVDFATKERCEDTKPCDDLKYETRSNWPDVPFDAICKEKEACVGREAPTFFTRKRLTGITTHVWDTAGNAYRPVNSWELKQTYLDPGDIGDTSDESLWLSSIRQTGRAGADITLPPLTFSHEWRTNRVDRTDDILPLNKPRLKTVTADTGAITSVTYSEPDCDATPEHRRMPTAEDDNVRRCYPVRWSPNGGNEPRLDWFHKYVVTDVKSSDPTGGSSDLMYHYDYDDPAWHYTEDPLTKPKERTWSQWRGFRTVTTLVGDPAEGVRSKTVAAYMQGMDGDRRADKTRRSVSVPAITAPRITDSNVFAGFLRENVTYDGDVEVSGVINDPWSKQTATRRYSWVDVAAGFVRTKASHTRTRITSGTSPTNRLRTVETTFDDYGMPVTVDDRGDNARTGDESCRRTWYARNPERGITELVARTRTLAVPCSRENEAALPATADTRGDVLSDVATAFDDAAKDVTGHAVPGTTWLENQKPTMGEPRWVGRANGYPNRVPVWQTVKKTVYDPLGRGTKVTDAKENATSTAYVPSDGGPLTQTVVTNASPRKQTTTTTFDPAWNLPTRIVDPNKKTTELAYDSLGRLRKVYLPNVAHPNGESPNMVFDYHLSATDASWVSTSTLRGNSVSKYHTTYQLYDSLLRPRQSQTPSATGGRVIAETFYNSRGLKAKTYADIYDDTADPSGKLYGTLNAQAPAEMRIAYDGAGREKTSTYLTNGEVQWGTTSTYTGDAVATTAPAGGSATRKISDAFGRLAELRTYKGTTPDTAAFTKVKYEYHLDGKPKTVVGTDNATWSYQYDLFGRKTSEIDPDKGATTTTYTVLDQIDSVRSANQKDPAKQSLLYAYDELGRKTAQWAGSRSDANLQASWSYDSVAEGQLDTVTRYVGGKAGQAYAQKILSFDQLYRPKKTQLVLPATDPLVAAGVPATLNFNTGYNVDGTQQFSDQPAVAGLPLESISFGYNKVGKPVTVEGKSGYVLGASYTPLGDLQQLRLGTSETNPKQVTLTNTYESGTRRLKRAEATDTSNPYKLQELTYDYDDAGNVLSIFDPTTRGGAGQVDYQCFTYDGYRRLEHVWTPKSADCSAANRTAANLGGAAPYWSKYEYNDAGLRSADISYSTAGETATAYRYAESGQPVHALTSTTTTKPGNVPASSRQYRYDDEGNTRIRPGVNGGQQTLTWDPEGHVQTTSEPATPSTPAVNTSYIYDGNGTLLLRRPTTGDGETVLYLGATEVRYTTAGAIKTLSASRQYDLGAKTVAVRSVTAGQPSRLSFIVSDHHGTATLAVNATVTDDRPEPQTSTKRYMTPFGAPRGASPSSWPDDKAFLGKPSDSRTGLTHIGAREFDPVIGRFLSVDPMLVVEDPQSLNGYTYANNNPVTLSDPTGLCIPNDAGPPGSCVPGTIGRVLGGNDGGSDTGGGDGGTSGGGTTGGDGGTSTSGGGTTSGGTGLTIAPQTEPGFAPPPVAPPIPIKAPVEPPVAPAARGMGRAAFGMFGLIMILSLLSGDSAPGPAGKAIQTTREQERRCASSTNSLSWVYNLPLDDGKRARGGFACLTPSATTIDTRPPATPVGWKPGMHRGHLIARELMGSSNLENIAPMYPSVNLEKGMRPVEREVRRRLDRNERVFYAVVPIYLGDGTNNVNPVPAGYRITINSASGYVNYNVSNTWSGGIE